MRHQHRRFSTGSAAGLRSDSRVRCVSVARTRGFPSLGRSNRGRGRLTTPRFRQIKLEHARARRYHRPLDNVLQFTNVSRPIVVLQHRYVTPSELGGGYAQPMARSVDTVRRKRRDVFRALAERGNGDRKDVQPVVKVFAKMATRNSLLQVLVRCRDRAHVHFASLRFSNALERSFL